MKDTVKYMPTPLKFAATIAGDSTLNGKPSKFWLGSVITKGGKSPISFGWNKMRSNPETLGEDFWKSTIDAEIDAMKKCNEETLKGATIYVARITKGGRELAMARPCHRCEAEIRRVGIKTVIYTINPYQFGVWRIYADQSNDIEVVRTLTGTQKMLSESLTAYYRL